MAKLTSTEALTAEGAAAHPGTSGVIPAATGGENRLDAAAHLHRHNVLSERIKGHLSGNAPGVRADLEHPDTNDRAWSIFNRNRGK